MGEQLARCWRVRTEDSRERNISLAKHKPSYETEMALFHECPPQCAQN